MRGGQVYAEDSFFTLSMASRVGLVCLSSAMAIATFWLARIAFRLVDGVPPVKRLLARLGISTGLFWAFVWLSPQVYYLYYQAIFVGLPWQFVVGYPPGLGALIDLLAFAAGETLSDHSKGALGWGLAIHAAAGMLPVRATAK